MSIGPDGLFYISDSFSDRVNVFDRTGRHVRSIGRRGSGPGEIESIGMVVHLDSQLFVGDVDKRQLHRYDLTTSDYRGSLAHPGILNGFAPYGHGAVFGMTDRANGTALGIWLPDDTLRQIGVLPDAYVESNPLASIFNGVAVATVADTIVWGLAAEQTIRKMLIDGTVVDSAEVPVRGRRGVPADLLKRFAEASFPEMFAMVSVMRTLHVLPTGVYAFLHYDQTIDGRLVESAVHLTFMSDDWGYSCADYLIRPRHEGRPMDAFKGDTLFLLDQRLTSSDSLVTEIAVLKLESTGRCHASR